MAYTGPYSISHRLLTEFLATLLALFTGLSLLANELLPKTKGHGLGFFGVAFGFGLAFGTAIAIFSYASAHLNPAMALALWVIGELSFVEMLATIAVEMVAGFVAACLVFLVYWPHFRTVPEVERWVTRCKYGLCTDNGR